MVWCLICKRLLVLAKMPSMALPQKYSSIDAKLVLKVGHIFFFSFFEATFGITKLAWWQFRFWVWHPSLVPQSFNAVFFWSGNFSVTNKEMLYMEQQSHVTKLNGQLQWNFGPHKEPSFREFRYRAASMENFTFEVQGDASWKACKSRLFYFRIVQTLAPNV